MAGFSPTSLSARTARGLRRGDPAAQAEAYRVLAPRVMGMAQRMLGDRGLAEEVVQDTFVSLIERAGSLRNAAAAVGWVRQTAVNHCLMRLRSPWQQRRVGEERVDMDRADPNQDGPREENLRDLERALGRLGEETRMVLWLHDVEGYTHREIAEVFGKSESFSKSRLARGYQTLLSEIGAETGAETEAQNGAEIGNENETGGEDDGFARADVGPACVS